MPQRIFLLFFLFISLSSFIFAQKPYHFVSYWKLKAPRKEVWDVINNSTQWNDWWKSIKNVEEKYVGDSPSGIGNIRSYTIKSPVGYKLHFDLVLTRREIDSVLEGDASGDLLGKGAWYFQEADSITTVLIKWDVATTIGWMNTFRFILSPVLRWNHALVMKKGAKGLARKMNTELISH